MAEYYNTSYAEDITIPNDRKFTTSISLKKKTYKEIDELICLFPLYRSRTQIIESAVEYFSKFMMENAQNEVKQNG